VARPDWPWVRVIDVADRDLERLSVDAATPADMLLSRFAGEVPGALLVVDQGHLVGIITRSDLIAAIQKNQ